MHIPDLYPMVTLMTCIGVVTKLTVCEAPQRRGAGAEKAPTIQAFSGAGHRSCICGTTRGTDAIRLLEVVPVESPGRHVARAGRLDDRQPAMQSQDTDCSGLTSDIPGAQDAMALSKSQEGD